MAKNKKNRLHPQELKRRLKLPFMEKVSQWKETREGKRQLSKFR